MMHGSIKLEYGVILEWVQKRSSVLDLGCGDGELLSILIREKQVHAQGIDIDEQAICRCVSRGLSVVQQDIDTGLSEYPDKSFNYTILNQSLQQVKKPDFVLKEAMRVGEKTIISFPNFCYYDARFKIFFGGRVPVTPALPYKWYDTPNLRFLSISDFIEFCNKRNIKIENSAFIRKNKRIRIFPNLFGEIGIFLLSI
ncbi:MAG: methionine biosynthesis protein MetW [Candidatus Jordarchaeum sp.]|uniref:methionine biosynthesis protein MetW n=1 Tax=Candidatus Jordarchaeum sp. TaxID=2823881 RepID=UPI00404AFEB2